MPLYYVQDADRPMHVLADDWGHAVKQWQERIRIENEEPDQEYGEPAQPQGVSLVCADDEFLMQVEAPPAETNPTTPKGYTRCDCCLCGTRYFVKPVEGARYTCPNPTCANGRHARHTAHFENFRSGLAKLRHDCDLDGDIVSVTLDEVEKLVEESFKAPDPSDEKMCIGKGDVLYFGIPDWLTVRANGIDMGFLRLRIQLVKAAPICDPPRDDGTPAAYRGMQWDAELDCTKVPGTLSVIVLTKGLPE